MTEETREAELLEAARGVIGPGDRYLDSRIARLRAAVAAYTRPAPPPAATIRDGMGVPAIRQATE